MRKFLFVLFFTFLIFPLSSSAVTPIKILLVPGHDEEVWGAQYGKTKEADMNLALANELFKILKKDKRFEVHITRDALGYTTEFADYFGAEQAEIALFRTNAKKNFQEKVATGDFVKKTGVPHNTVSQEISNVLYGINKWANENKMDAVIHIHFNDYPRKNAWTKGIYKGFTIYVPEEQLLNSKESILLGKKIFTELHKKYSASTYPKENGGFAKDQDLIALGASDSLIPSVRSVLVEYGYIYRFGNSNVRAKAYKTMANLTAVGLKSYFFPKK